MCGITGLVLWDKKPNKAVIYFVLSLIFLVNLYHSGITKQLEEIKNLMNNNVETKQIVNEDVKKIE